MDKILEDDTKGDPVFPIPGLLQFFDRHPDDVFDEIGDEFDCHRIKALHG